MAEDVSPCSPHCRLQRAPCAAITAAAVSAITEHLWGARLEGGRQQNNWGPCRQPLNRPVSMLAGLEITFFDGR